MPIRKFHWDPIDDCVMSESDPSGNTLVTFAREPGMFGPLLSQDRAGDVRHHHFDGLGSTTLLTDSTGGVTDTFRYDAWGNILNRTGITETPYQWVGRWGYQSTSVSRDLAVRSRTFRPSSGRWLSRDPSYLTRESTSSFNLDLYTPRDMSYGYVLNRPVMFVDPSGLRPFEGILDTVGGALKDATAEGVDKLKSAYQRTKEFASKRIEEIKNMPKDIAEKQCRAWTAAELKKNQDWLNKLPACPCFICEFFVGESEESKKWDEPVKAPKEHPGALWCIRTLAGKGLVKNFRLEVPANPGQQCCYNGDGDLITGGAGAGTPDLAGAYSNVEEHFRLDVYPFLVCEKAGLVSEYLKARPPNNKNNCQTIES